MKILVLHPSMTAESPAMARLGSAAGLVVTSTNSEAWTAFQVHSGSIDLLIVHREGRGGRGEPGIDFLKQARQETPGPEMAVILTSDAWGDAEFAAHQGTTLGANAYLKSPYADDALVSLVEAVLGCEFPKAIATGARAPVMTESPAAVAVEESSFVFDLPMARAAGGFELDSPALSLPGVGDISMPTAVPDSSLAVPAPPEPSASELLAPIDPAALFASSGASSLQAQEEPALAEEPDPAFVAAADGGPAYPGGSTPEPASAPPLEDERIQVAMPYLFGRPKVDAYKIAQILSQPIGDAVVPGGAVAAPDIETLKKYLLLREQDVGALSTQLQEAQTQIGTLEQGMGVERARSAELDHVVREQAKRIEEFEKERARAVESLQVEIAELKSQMRAKSDRAKALETQTREAAEEMERIKERVRTDLRKIRVREKELENRLELMRRDSEALLVARENRIIELKRKIDLIEFNVEVIQDQYAKEKETAARLRERLARAAEVVRAAGGVLEDPAPARTLVATGETGRAGSAA